MGINYFRRGNLVEIIIRDDSGAKIETHKCNIKDKKKYAAILRYLRDKYGFEPEISSNDINWFK